MTRTIEGYGAPTTKTIGTIGDRYVDLNTGSVYSCTDVNVKELDYGFIDIRAYSAESTEYIWEAVGAASSLKGIIDRSIIEFDFPDGITRIGNYAFANCNKLCIPKLPDGIEYIGSYAFFNCAMLDWVELPDSVNNIQGYGFSGCSKLALTKIPDNVTNISIYGFHMCSKLVIDALPPLITAVNQYAFYKCEKITISRIHSGIKTIGAKGFYGCLGLTEMTFDTAKKYTSPSEYTWNITIASDAFSGCTNLLTINVPWSEGDVANAPWGATNATINYDYVAEE